MNLHPHISLAFNDQCEAAFRLYEQCLGGTITYMVWRAGAVEGGGAKNGHVPRPRDQLDDADDRALVISDRTAPRRCSRGNTFRECKRRLALIGGRNDILYPEQ